MSHAEYLMSPHQLLNNLTFRYIYIYYVFSIGSL